mmetsp:Transcript_31756/g.64557  ORF Transcript_31756/g.64557 Transcript_31756/m.64557 type:complete len:940 (+) Transcript_31756:135-2954(+)
MIKYQKNLAQLSVSLIWAVSALVVSAQSNSSFVNPIVEENSKAGADSKFWDVNGAGDPTIQGFATQISVAPGEDAIFKVNAPTVTSYRADIYRLGYYGGTGARKVATMRPPPGQQLQPDCRFENDTLLVDCSAWGESFRWRVPETAVSGLYIARLVREDAADSPSAELSRAGGTWRSDNSPVADAIRNGADQGPCSDGSSSASTHAYGCPSGPKNKRWGKHKGALKDPRASLVYLVVRASALQLAHALASAGTTGQADVLFQTMDTTWQAYNCWGGVNSYGYSCGGSSSPTHAGSPSYLDAGANNAGVAPGGGSPSSSSPPRRATKVSYNRPFATRAYRAANMPFGYEYPMVRWLERNGFHVIYWAASDADKFFSTAAAAASAEDKEAGLHGAEDKEAKSAVAEAVGAALRGKAKVYLSLGHDEYWSGKQRLLVESARDQGMSLAFMGANSMFWKVKWGGDHRSFVVGKETLESSSALLAAAAAAPAKKKNKNKHTRSGGAREQTYDDDVGEEEEEDEEWTGTWRDGRSVNSEGAQPENALMGQLFTVNAWRSDALAVPVKRFGGNRFWRHTQVERSFHLLAAAAAKHQEQKQQEEQCTPRAVGDGDDGGRRECVNNDGNDYHHHHRRHKDLVGSSPIAGSLQPLESHLFASLLGHEVDEDVENGFRPPGLMHLSSSALEHVQYLVDEGATYDTGSMTHHLALYKHQNSGALVFSSGTCRWSWGLDGHHDLETGLDVKVGANAYTLRVGVDSLRPDGDPTLQQATLNVLADMGVFPATPQKNLVVPSQSSDVTPPRIGEVAGQWPHVIAGVSVIHGTASDVRRREIAGNKATNDEGGDEQGGEQGDNEGGGDGSGIVAGVEVSEDGGGTWASAELEAAGQHGAFDGTWSYRLTTLAKAMGKDGQVEVLVRAVDDSGNISEEWVTVVAKYFPHMAHMRAD